jgi:hypothetical protein
MLRVSLLFSLTLLIGTAALEARGIKREFRAAGREFGSAGLSTTRGVIHTGKGVWNTGKTVVHFGAAQSEKCSRAVRRKTDGRRER